MSVNDIAEPVGLKTPPAAPPMHADAYACFTDHQWYCHQARQTVYFASFFSETPDRDGLIDLAEDVAGHIPELGALYEGLTGMPLGREALSRIVSIEQTDDLDAYPDLWDMSGADVFARHDLPMLRIRAAVRRDGADAAGRRGALLVVSTHALFEGADSALLSRSQPTGHGTLSAPSQDYSLTRRIAYGAMAALLGPAQLLAALIVAPRQTDKTCRSLVFQREKLRRVAAKLGLGQRGLMFALALHALNKGGKGYSRKKISATYAHLDMPGRAGSEGAYFRHWVSEAGFKVDDDFLSFARNIETELNRLEKSDKRATQGLLHAVFGAHRIMRRWLPFLYSDRIFRFAGLYQVNLTVTPPHRLQGPLTKNMVEPVHAGSYHPGLDMCIFVPGRKMVTFNFALGPKVIDQVDAIPGLLDALDAEPER